MPHVHPATQPRSRSEAASGATAARWSGPESTWNESGERAGDQRVSILGSCDPRPLLGRHPDGAVEADHFAVEHFVLEDVTHQRRVLLGPAEARWKRHLLRE